MLEAEAGVAHAAAAAAAASDGGGETGAADASVVVHAHVAALLAGRAPLVGSLRQSLELALAERVVDALAQLLRCVDRNFSLQWLARARQTKRRGGGGATASASASAAADGNGEAGGGGAAASSEELFFALLGCRAVLPLDEVRGRENENENEGNESSVGNEGTNERRNG